MVWSFCDGDHELGSVLKRGGASRSQPDNASAEVAEPFAPLAIEYA
jgi:hypothetical protein